MTCEKIITSIGELISEVELIYSCQNYLLWFRGHSDKDHSLIPSVQRDGLNNNEQYISNDFYMKASLRMRDKPNKYDYAAWMALMQHYGLPTRLLDWSKSPLIAAYFATCNYEKFSDKDACIWILKPGLLNESEGFNGYLYPMDTNTALDMMYPAFKPYKDSKRKVEDKILACYPVENDLRMYTQQSAFTIHNTHKKLEQLDISELLNKLIIPSNCKNKILKELRICGIELSTVYPDIEHVSKEIKEFYRKR